MRGDKVIVRSYGNKPLIRRVWGDVAGAIYVCSERAFEENLNALRDTIAGAYCAGFPAEDVFQYDDTVAEDDPAFWDKLTPYAPPAHPGAARGGMKEG